MQKEFQVISYDRAATRARLNTYDFLHLASVPADENCTQAGADYNLQRLECESYIRQLMRETGPPPPGAEFFIVENSHEFGTYLEAAIWYSRPGEDEEGHDIDSPSYDYGLKCEAGPEYWDDQAKRELIETGYFKYVGATILKMKVA